MNLFEGICGKVAPGLCRLSLNGGIAVKTGSGYRTYDLRRGRLVHCDSFVLDIGEDFFFVIPTNHVKPGDIILSGGRPRCVIKEEDGTITAVNYEDATVEKLLPEHHVFMGSTYLYGRIVSLLGRNGIQGKRGTGRMIRYMMLSGMMREKNDGMNSLLPMLLLGGKTDFLEDLFDGEPDDEKEDPDDPEEKED